jgi:hypothetical protein
MRKGAWVLALLVLTACGSAGPTAMQTPSTSPLAMASASPASSPVPSPSSASSPTPYVSPKPITPAPTTPKPVAFTCSSPIPAGASLALVTLRGSADVVVRDITDISRPVSRCTFKTCIQNCKSFGPRAIRFIDSTHVSYLVDGNTLYVTDLQTRKNTLVLWVKDAQGILMEFAWAPDGSALVYVLQPPTPGAGMALHQLKAGRDRVLATMPAMPAVGCEQQCIGQDTWDFSLLYSLDGTNVSLTDSIVKPVFRVWKADGKQLNKVDSETRAWSVWSGDGLYFDGAAGVSVWRAGAITTFLPGKVWIRPDASPGAGQIVYDARDSAGWLHVYLVETTTAKIFELKKARGGPVYLTARYVWYGGQRACVASDNCAAFPTTSDGKTYIYDLLNSTEAESIITSVSDTWPHAA